MTALPQRYVFNHPVWGQVSWKPSPECHKLINDLPLRKRGEFKRQLKQEVSNFLDSQLGACPKPAVRCRRQCTLRIKIGIDYERRRFEVEQELGGFCRCLLAKFAGVQFQHA